MKIGTRRLFWMPLRTAVWFAGLHVAAVLTVGTLEAIFRVTLSSATIAQFRDFESKVFIAMVCFYAFNRVVAYFPIENRSYSNWLLTTPYRASRPLPLGPVHLVWEDLAPLLVAWWIGADPVLLLVSFAACYVPVALLFSAGEEIASIASAIAFLIPAVALAWTSPKVVVVLVLLILALSQVAIWRALAKVPWIRGIAAVDAAKRKTRMTSEWPVGPAIPATPVSRSAGWLIAILVGWWVYAGFATALPLDPGADGTQLLAIPSLVLAGLGFGRWVIYCGMYQPPISTWGRIRTLRLIIPGYDYVLIAPPVIIFLGITLPMGLRLAGLGLPLCVGLPTVVVIATSLNLGPTLRHWQLTGHHRIAKQTARRRRKRITD